MRMERTFLDVGAPPISCILGIGSLSHFLCSLSAPASASTRSITVSVTHQKGLSVVVPSTIASRVLLSAHSSDPQHLAHIIYYLGNALSGERLLAPCVPFAEKEFVVIGFVPMMCPYRVVAIILGHAGWPRSEMLGISGNSCPRCNMNP